ncbi:putative lipid-transfer protein DIR1, partial [Tanacetum coccineum]
MRISVSTTSGSPYRPSFGTPKFSPEPLVSPARGDITPFLTKNGNDNKPLSFDICHVNKNALRIKLGVLRCETSQHSYAAVVPLLIFVPLVKDTNYLEKMGASMKNIFLVGVLVVLVIAELSEVNGAGECGKANPDMEAFKLAPCASAAQDENASVSS